MPYKNIEDNKACWRRWYSRNKVHVVEKNHARKKEYRKYIHNYKFQAGCFLCHESDPRCLDLHHKKNSRKTINIAEAITKGWGKAKLLDELKKCEVICANCHRKLHFK